VGLEGRVGFEPTTPGLKGCVGSGPEPDSTSQQPGSPGCPQHGLRLPIFVQLLTRMRCTLRPRGMGAFRFVNIARKSGMLSSSQLVASKGTIRLRCVG
jgi:hypothetical protein